jgi:hypothetical protein
MLGEFQRNGVAGGRSRSILGLVGMNFGGLVFQGGAVAAFWVWWNEFQRLGVSGWRSRSIWGLVGMNFSGLVFQGGAG